jgi:hypothetical protein
MSVASFVSDFLARLAQSVERQPFKLVVVGSNPTVGKEYKVSLKTLFEKPTAKFFPL